MKISLKNHISYIHHPLATYRMHNNTLLEQNLKQHIIELENWLSKNEKFLKKGYKLSQQNLFIEVKN